MKILAASVALTAAIALPAVADTSPGHATVTDDATSCAALAGTAIPEERMTLPTSGGRVTATQLMTDTSGVTPLTYCQVDAAISPVDPGAPDIRLRVALPTAWNGKAFMFGGGGYDGTIPNVAGNVPFGPSDQPTPLRRGYATFASDSGHQADPTFVPTTSLDGSFGVNDEAVRNFAGDALKKTYDAARYVMGLHYATEPSKKYFAGGSTGDVKGWRWPSGGRGRSTASSPSIRRGTPPAWTSTSATSRR